MRYVMWAIKLVIFAVVVLFAYKNMAPVDVQLFGSAQIISVPLVVVMLVTFVAGTLLGVLLMLPSTWRRSREAGRLKRDLAKVGKLAARSADSKSQASSPTTTRTSAAAVTAHAGPATASESVKPL